MACKFPLAGQGQIPQRCLQIPFIRIEQSGFDCARGYDLLCDKNYDLGGQQHKFIDDPSNMAAANFSRTSKAYFLKTRVEYNVPRESSFYIDSSKFKDDETRLRIKENAKSALKYLCTSIDYRTRPTYCPSIRD
jgi:hypothetical protein